MYNSQCAYLTSRSSLLGLKAGYVQACEGVNFANFWKVYYSDTLKSFYN